MKTLPQYVRFETPELAFAAIQFLLRGGIYSHSVISETNKSFFAGGPKTLSFRDNYIGYYSERGNIPENEGPSAKVSTWPEFHALLVDPPLEIGGHVVEFKADGVQVGCTFVKWETIEAVLKRKP